MRHLWQMIGNAMMSSRIRCQTCEEIMTFSCNSYAYEYLITDRSYHCEGMPGPKPQNFQQIQEEY